VKGPQYKGLTKDNLQKLYVEDKSASLASVGKIIGCSDEAVRRWLRNYGLPIRPPGSEGRGPLKKETQKLADKEWMQEQLETKTGRQLAEELGCSEAAFCHWKRKHGLVDKTYNNKSSSIKQALKKRYPKGRSGEDHPGWKGGRVMQQGYVLLYAPDHPAAKSKPYVQEHRLVMEAHLGRYLRDNEVVHHLNGDKEDNRIDNLELIQRGKHVSNHFRASHEVVELRQENKRLLQQVAELEERIKELEE
jgi:hypothetical protein